MRPVAVEVHAPPSRGSVVQLAWKPEGQYIRLAGQQQRRCASSSNGVQWLPQTCLLVGACHLAGAGPHILHEGKDSGAAGRSAGSSVHQAAASSHRCSQASTSHEPPHAKRRGQRARFKGHHV